MPVFDRIIYTVYLSVKKILFFLLGYIFAISVYANNQNKIDIFVSIPPQKFLVEEIGGDKVNVNVMLKPGTNPETYEPTPRQIAALNDSNIYFQVGVPFEAVWIDRVKQINKQLKIISCCKNLFEQTAPVHDLDAHVWTSPENAKKLVTIIKNTLIEHDPANQSTYEEKYSVLINKLDQLDIEIRKQTIIDEVRLN